MMLSRRKLLLVMMLLLTLHLQSPEKRTREAARTRTRMHHQEFVALMTSTEFARYYRISKPRFEQVVRDITPRPRELRKKRAAATRGGHGKTFIEYDLRLSIALRYLAGGSYLDLMYLHGVGKSSVFHLLWDTLERVDAALPEFTLEDDIHDLERCKELSAAFAAKTDGHIVGAIAAWDGIAVKVERPCYKDASNQNKFWCRKGFPAVSVQAACDADRRFSYFSLEFAGSVHDSRAYRLARTRCGGFICREMADSRTLQMTGDDHPHGFFVLGDDAYPYSNYMCVPWVRVNGKPARDAFNYHQSRGRINIECSFGMLVKKFLVLGRPMMCALPRVQLIVRVSMKLHNACIDDRLGQHGIHSSDYTGAHDTAYGSVATHRASADTRTHCSSGTHRADGTLSPESALPAWEEEDVPEDLVPNRTDLAGGPRQELTDRLDGMGICRPNLRLWGR